MKDQNKLFYFIGYVLYLTYRSAYLVGVLAPVWTRRFFNFMMDDLDTAKRVYSGNNVRIVFLDTTPTDQTNNYHLRYKDSERGN